MRYIILFFLSLNIFAESLTLNLVKEVPTDGKKFIYSLSELKSSDYMLGLGILGTGLIATTFDDNIKTFVNNHKSDTLDHLSPVFRSFGEFYPSLVLVGAGYLFDNDKSVKTGFYAAEASILGAGITYVAKNIFARARPYTNEGSHSWGNESFNSDYSSFPSGHSTVAFATAAVIADMYSDKKYIPQISYTLATMTALSRIYDDKHWFSDVLLGSSIGYLTGKALMKIKKEDNTYIGPQSDGKNIGIAFGGRF